MEQTTVISIKAILEACTKFRVKKLVVTLSLACVNGPGFKPSGSTYDERDFALD
jgi:nucleoside-diphosphate-sugar epimerase